MGVALITREARRLKPGAPVRKAPGLTFDEFCELAVAPGRAVLRGWVSKMGVSQLRWTRKYLVLLADNRTLMCVMRVDSGEGPTGRYAPVVRSFSTDAGDRGSSYEADDRMSVAAVEA